MLRFSCPTCHRVYECPSSAAGRKIDCFCGQHVQIPGPQLKKTVIGKIEAPPQPRMSGLAKVLIVLIASIATLVVVTIIGNKHLEHHG